MLNYAKHFIAIKQHKNKNKRNIDFDQGQQICYLRKI
jgi:hypothetical protein